MLIDLSINDKIAIVRINNPKKLNALSVDLMEELYEKIFDIGTKASALVITGTEKAFAAGMDVSEIAARDYEQAHIGNLLNSHWEELLNVKIPVIAAVSGYAFGGGFELVLYSDVVIASETAQFAFPEINLGVMPGLGGTQLLTRAIGTKMASKILMTGERISAQRAYDLGIVSQVVAPNDLVSTATNLAQELSNKPKMSLLLIKEAIRMSQNCGLSQGIQTERTMFRSLFSTMDKQKRTNDFLSKKK